MTLHSKGSSFMSRVDLQIRLDLLCIAGDSKLDQEPFPRKRLLPEPLSSITCPPVQPESSVSEILSDKDAERQTVNCLCQIVTLKPN